MTTVSPVDPISAVTLPALPDVTTRADDLQAIYAGLESRVVRKRAPRGTGFGPLLIPLDGSVRALSALGPAAALATGLGSELVLAHVAQRASALPGEVYGEARRALRRDPAHGAPRALALSAAPGTSPARVLLGAAREEMASMIVMTTHGEAATAGTVLGSVADEVVRGSSLPVLLVRDPVGAVGAGGGASPSRYAGVPWPHHLLVALSGTSRDDLLLRWVGAHAPALGATVTLLRVACTGVVPATDDWEFAGAASTETVRARRHSIGTAHAAAALYLDQATSELVRQGMPRDLIKRVVRTGSTGQMILDQAAVSRAGMLVMGAPPRGTMMRYVVRGTSCSVLARARIPVLLIPETVSVVLPLPRAAQRAAPAAVSLPMTAAGGTGGTLDLAA
jgi:nucleotide-binding universal stress UspA family protein